MSEANPARECLTAVAFRMLRHYRRMRQPRLDGGFAAWLEEVESNPRFTAAYPTPGALIDRAAYQGEQGAALQAVFVANIFHGLASAIVMARSTAPDAQAVHTLEREIFSAWASAIETPAHL